MQDGYIAWVSYRSIALKTINLINRLRVFNAHVHSAILTSRPTVRVYEAVYVVLELLGSIIPKCSTGSSLVFGKLLWISLHILYHVYKISIILR